MMGLGSKRVTKLMMHPTQLSKLRNADEVLSDVVTLGAIVTFAVGMLMWLAIENPPMAMFEHYELGGFVRSFVSNLFVEFCLFILLYYVMADSPIVSRILIVLIGVFFGLALGIARILGSETFAVQLLFACLASYSFAIAGLALFQAIQLKRNIVEESA